MTPPNRPTGAHRPDGPRGAHDDTVNAQVIEAVEEWASRHPKPDAPLAATGKVTYTARQFAAAAAISESAAAAYLRRALASGLTIEEALAALYRRR